MKFLFAFMLPLILSHVLAQQTPERDGTQPHGASINLGPEEGVICDGDTSFELMTGYVYTSAEDIILSRENVKFLKECVHMCKGDARCRAVNFETGLCITFRSSAGENSEMLQLSQLPVFTLYAQKVCMPRGFPSCPGAWAYETSPNIGVLPRFAQRTTKVASRLECAAECINSEDCRSASYNSDGGTCTFSGVDRFIVGSSRSHLRVASNEYHIENYCHKRAPRTKCHFRQITGKILKTVDAFYNNTVEDEEGCKELCLKTEDFPCRTYHFMKSDRSKDSFCRLSHHSQASLSHIKDPYIAIEDNNSYELTSCYQVNVECRGDGMSATINTGQLFDGKVYARGRANTCAVDASGDSSVKIDLLYDDLNCDVIREAEGNYVANIVVQNHDMIVTSQDIGLSLHCKYFLDNQTVTNDLPFIELKDGVQTEYVKETIVESPDVSMAITNPNGNPIISAQVGDNLKLMFTIDNMNSPFEIFVRDLIAKGSDDKDEIVLIDGRGCPAQPSIMRAVLQVEGSGKKLETAFNAFKFPDDDVVQFKALVTPCIPRCEPVMCDGDSFDRLGTQSYGRKKRAVNEETPFLLAKSIKITDKFAFEDALTQQIVNKEETTLYKACISTYALMVAIALFVVAEVVLLVIWRNLWHNRRSNKHIAPLDGAIPPEVLFGSLSSRSSSTRYLTS